MEPARHLEVLLREGRRLAAMPVEALDAPVPAVPGWTLEHVVRHTGKVHRWVTALVGAGPGADPEKVAAGTVGLPRGSECLPAYAEALEGVHSALAELDPDDDLASFIGPATARFWQRRQAHEVTVHRVDAADAVRASGGPAPAPIDPPTAADGIDEWATVFLGTRWNQRFGRFPPETEGWTVDLHGTDFEPASWRLTFGGGTASLDAAGAALVGTGGRVVLRGAAEQLLLVLWRRRPLEALDVAGDRAVAERLIDLARF